MTAVVCLNTPTQRHSLNWQGNIFPRQFIISDWLMSDQWAWYAPQVTKAIFLRIGWQDCASNLKHPFIELTPSYYLVMMYIYVYLYFL